MNTDKNIKIQIYVLALVIFLLSLSGSLIGTVASMFGAFAASYFFLVLYHKIRGINYKKDDIHFVRALLTIDVLWTIVGLLNHG